MIFGKKLAIAGLLLIPVLCGAQTQSAPSPRMKYNFNPGWKLFVGDTAGAETPGFDDHAWKPITLPHAFNEDDAFKKPIQDLSVGIAWYRKHFRVLDPNGAQPGTTGRTGATGTTESTASKIFLEFEGIRQAGEFWLNGQFIGRHENGVMAFGWDITDKIKYGEDNILAVRVDNRWDYKEKATGSSFEWNDRNFYANYGGINKNVFLHSMGRLYQTLPLYSTLGSTGVYVYANDFDIARGAATITTETQVKNEYPAPKTFQLKVTIKDRDGKIAGTQDGGSYTVAPGQTITAKAAGKVTGLHWWSWGYGYLYTVTTELIADGKTIDLLNTVTGFRKTEFANGALKLNDRVIQVKGYGQRTTNEWPAIGVSVPAWLSQLSDHLMIESNANLVRWMHVTPWKQDIEACDRVGLMEAMPAGDSERDVDGRRWEQRVELMRDAIIYNRNNPSIIFYECGNKGISETHMAQMKAVRDQFDPHGGRAIGAREMLASQTAEYGGEMLYINKSAGKPLWQMEYSRDEGLRKYWDEYSPPYHKDGDGPQYKGEDAAIYNRNQDSHAIEDVLRWYDYWHERPGTGSRVNAGGVNIIFSESNTHYRGAENYRRSGEVDALRIPKDGFWAHRVVWDGWVDIEKPRIHIIGHWNYTPGVKKDIYVVSSAEKVELFVNGHSKGWGEQTARFLYTFKNISWEPGTISAIGYDAKGGKLAEASHTTAGKPAAIRLTVQERPGGMVADGADLALVEVEVVDGKGLRCPTDLSMIHFGLSGPAEWRGGIAQGPDNYILSKELPVECGVNRVLIRSTPQAGTITLKAEGEGLQSATISILSKPFINHDGLATLMPDQGLPAPLDRGATPAGESYTATRKALKILSATAGANGDKAAQSYDDNETTAWNNDGQLSTAWIQYELDRPAAIRQIALKLNSFRTRSYSLRISIDGKEAWKGVSAKNLGYYTLSFPPTTGKIVRIELQAGGDRSETAGKEVNGKKLDDGIGESTDHQPGQLSIIEAEIYAGSGSGAGH